MRVFEQLYTNLKAVLDTVESLQEAHVAPTLKFNGYPAAFIVPSGNESDFLTTNDNQRIYAFKIWAFEEYDKENPNAAYPSLVAAVDDIITQIDLQENPDTQTRTMATDLGDGYTLLAVMATPSRFALDEEEKLLGAEITVRCKVTVDLTVVT